MSAQKHHDHLNPHSHDPNPDPPSTDPSFTLSGPGDFRKTLNLAALKQLPQKSVANCYIVSTGHGTSGPFTFSGVRLLDLIDTHISAPWTEVEVISDDGFGNRVFRSELQNPDPAGPIILAHSIDGKQLQRADGLVRLIVPSERDDALRQVKWVGRINVR